jgi:multidrug efflux pump subunit AcrB
MQLFVVAAVSLGLMLSLAAFLASRRYRSDWGSIVWAMLIASFVLVAVAVAYQSLRVDSRILVVVIPLGVGGAFLLLWFAAGRYVRDAPRNYLLLLGVANLILGLLAVVARVAGLI